MNYSPIQIIRRFAILFVTMLLVLAAHPARADVVLASWDVRGQSNYGTSPLPASVVDANVDTVGLTRGSGVTVPGSGAAGNAWGGTAWNVATATDAINANKFATFAVSGKAGFKISIASIDRLDYRRSGTGATSGVLQYQIGSGSFVDIQTLAYTVSASAGASLGPINLSNITELQNIPAGTVVTFRIVSFGASASGGTWYVYDVAGSTAADLSVTGLVTPEGALPPTISGFNPTQGGVGTAVTITGTNFGATPTVKFNGVSAPGAVATGGTSITVNVPTGATTGPITVTADGSVTSASAFTVLAQPTLTVNLGAPAVPETGGAAATTGTVTVSAAPAANLTVTLTSSDTSEATVPATVVIPAGELVSNSFDLATISDGVFDPDAVVTITASATGHDPGTATITVQNVDSPPTTVVVNKYVNSPDLIELLVIASGTPNSVTDMRGMIIKDYTGSMGGDAGGKFSFNLVTLFESVKAGTLITLNATATSSDTDASDFTLNLGLLDTTYFTSLGGSYDIATTEMVSIKAAGSGAVGTVGTIHTLAGGAAGALFTAAPTPKLLATGTSGTGLGVIANNSTSSLADYNGSDATGGVALTAASFGTANNLTNNTYIRQLRGITNLDGSGVATVSNGTPASLLSGKNIFPRNTAGQAVTLSVIADASPGLIVGVKFTVPTAFGAPLAANVSVAGAGAGVPLVSVSGQDVTVTGTAISISNSAEITIGGLTTPNPILLTDDGRYIFAMQTSGTGGSLTPVATSPVVIVTIPVENLRDVSASAVPLDNGKVVAIEGVCTEENFNTAGTSAFVQEGNFGINVFSSAGSLALVRGNKYALTGQITQFNGLSEIVVPTISGVVDLGAGIAPTPLTITLADLALNYEAYEGRLVRVAGLSKAPANTGVWGSAATISMQDALANLIDVRIQAGSTATTEPAYPTAITGILGQFDSTTPFTASYQIMPRDQADIEGAPVANYASWINTYYPGETNVAIIGFDADPDGDGIGNGIEHAFALDPSVVSSPGLFTVVGSPSLITFTHKRNKSLATDVVIAYEWSKDMNQWAPPGSFLGDDSVTIVVDSVDTSNPAYDVVNGRAALSEGTTSKFFIRARVTK